MATDAQDSYGPPRIEMLSALRRHWFVALIPVVVLVAASVVLGLEGDRDSPDPGPARWWTFTQTDVE